MKDYYKILDVEKNATDEDIKKSFRKLSLIHHPDKGGDENKFKEINEAYMTLSNPQKRQEYDNPMSGGSMFDFMFRNYENIDISKLNIDGDDMQIKFNISFSYIILGGTFKTSIKYNDYCDNCKGSGFLTSETCNDCNGSGFTIKRQSNGFMHFESRSQCNTCKGTGKKGIDKCTNCNSSGVIIIEKELVLNIQKNYNKMVPFILKDQGLKGRNKGKNGDIIIFLNPIFPRYEDLKDEEIKCFERFKNEKSSS